MPVLILNDIFATLASLYASHYCAPYQLIKTMCIEVAQLII